MRILFVSQYFPPEMGAPAARVGELTSAWAEAGEEVTVLTGFAHHPTGRKARRDRWRLTRRERSAGVDVVRAYVWATPNRGKVRRMISYASFMVAAVVVGRMRVRRPQVVVATSPQLLAAVAGYLLARLFRVPFVLEIRDLWPESILAVNAMAENPVVRGLQRVARFLYRRSDVIVTVGEGYRRQIHRRYGIPLAKMHVVPNGIRTDLFVPGPKENEVRRQYGWQGRFVVMYVGTHGMAHALHKVLEVAELLADDDRLHFVFVGEGAEKDRLKRLAGERRLTNVHFIDQQPKERIPLFYAACDLGLVTLRAAELFADVLPSKIFEYLGMERPIVLTVGGEARRIVEASGGGVWVPPEDVPAMASAIRRLAAAGEDDLAGMGSSARAYVVAHFHRARQAERYLELLLAAAGRSE